jgi:hypothetical protein
MPKSKKPRKPKSAVKQGKTHRNTDGSEAWSSTQKQHEHSHKPNADVRITVHNRQPPKHGM